MIAAGAAIHRFTLNLSCMEQPWVLVAATVVSDMNERLSPKNAPPTIIPVMSGTLEPVPAAMKLMPDAPKELPYEGAKELLLVENVDNREFLRELIESVWKELPEKKKKQSRKE